MLELILAFVLATSTVSVRVDSPPGQAVVVAPPPGVQIVGMTAGHLEGRVWVGDGPATLTYHYDRGDLAFWGATADAAGHITTAEAYQARTFVPIARS